MDALGDQLFAYPALAADQGRGRTAGHLRDLSQHAGHRGRVSDDVGRSKPLGQLALQARVFALQGLILLARRLSHAHCLREHGGDDGQQTNILVERHLFAGQPVHAQRAHDLLAVDDGNADEGNLPTFAGAVPPAGACTIEKQWLIDHVGYDGGLAGGDHPARDPLAKRVAATLHLVRAEPKGVLDDDGPGGAIENRDGPAQHAHPGGHPLQDGPGDLVKGHRSGEFFAHF